jgi:hypothetical protein
MLADFKFGEILEVAWFSHTLKASILIIAEWVTLFSKSAAVIGTSCMLIGIEVMVC